MSIRVPHVTERNETMESEHLDADIARHYALSSEEGAAERELRKLLESARERSETLDREIDETLRRIRSL